MDIKNTRTNQQITVKEACSLLSKTKGLMFSKPCPLLMVFKVESRVPLHTCFVFFDLDIYYLDNTLMVVEKTLMKPFRMYSPKREAKFVLEVPCSFNFKTEIGDQLEGNIRR